MASIRDADTQSVAFTVATGKITRIDASEDPQRLGRFNLAVPTARRMMTVSHPGRGTSALGTPAARFAVVCSRWSLRDLH